MAGLRLSLSDLTCDDLVSIASATHLIQMRSICKGLKDKIENISDFSIKLSKQGLQCATSDFFSKFRGRISIESTYGLDPMNSWFQASMKRRLDLVALHDVRLKHSNIPDFCAGIYKDPPVKVQTMTMTYTGSIDNLLDSQTRQGHAAERIEAKFELTYRRPHEALSDAVRKILDLDGSFDLKILDLK